MLRRALRVSAESLFSGINCFYIIRIMEPSKQRVGKVLSHERPDRFPVDFGATAVTGIHCKVVEALRDHYGLERRPVRIVETLQMLGEVDEELKRIMHVDCEPAIGCRDFFGCDTRRLHEQRTPWGQTVLLPDTYDLTPDTDRNIWIYPRGDRSVPPSGVLPDKCYFMNAVERCGTVDDARLDPEDNLEEYGLIGDEDFACFVSAVERAAATGRAVVLSYVGTALGDVAFISGPALSRPRGIRSVSEWYMSTLLRPDYIHRLFDRQVDYAIANCERLWKAVGEKVDVIYTCGTDFGSQESQFCSEETFRELWLPHYRRLNDWIHRNTTWKIFKHSCGSMMPLLPALIDAGFDIFNPVQVNARNMDPHELKDRFGDRLVFWGGIDTQQVMPFGTPRQVADHVRRQVDIFSEGGGFVLNTVHNIQANVPVENVVALIETVNELRGL